MRSPFPGMDPYLEAPTCWAGVHHRLLSAIADTLGDALAPAFIIAVEERVYIATPDDLLKLPWLQPNVFLVRASDHASTNAFSTVITPPLVIEPLEEEEVREHYLEILDTETRAVVATIEVLSPTNKAAGTSGREKFLVPDTPLDLQAIVELAYRRGHYDIAINYDRPAPPPLMSSDDAQWIREQIAAWRQ